MSTMYSNYSSYLRSALSDGALLIMSGCTAPSLNLLPSSVPITPTVAQLEDHVTCTLVDAIDNHLGQPALDQIARLNALASQQTPEPEHVHRLQDLRLKLAERQLWQKIVDYNVQDAVNMTLSVTQTQGLNPSFSFITPLTALGHPIEKIVDSSNGITTPTNVTSGNFSRALSIGFGLNGSQTHNIVITYTIDLHKIYNAMYDTSGDGNPKPFAYGAKTWCDRIRAEKSPAGVSYGLKGDLGLVETLEAGLQAMDRGSYSPAVAGSGSPSTTSLSGSTALVSQSAGATGFSSKVDFTLGWGVNGGANWTLLKFKGPTGGSSQPLSYSRSKEDTLISSYSATCHADRGIDLMDSRYFYAPVLIPQSTTQAANRSFELQVYLRRHPELGRDQRQREVLPYPEGAEKFYDNVGREIFITIAVGKDTTGLDFTYSGNATGAITSSETPLFADKMKRRSPNTNGTISVSSFNTNLGTTSSYSERGAISDGVSGSFIGYLHAGITFDTAASNTVNNLDISQNALRLLLEENGAEPADMPTKMLLGETEGVPVGFWASLPSCSTAAPFFLNSQNVLQQLPRNVSDTLQQQ